MAEWRRRHHALLVLLWCHVVAVPIYSSLRGYGGLHAVAHALPLVAYAALATRECSRRRRTSAVAVSLGLLTASALIVHASHGLIEAHFHFFVMIIVLTVYEDWLPFGLAVAFVFLHHGVLGALDQGAVYDHDGSPWLWAAIHGGFVLAAGVGAIACWRLNEDVRTQAGEVEERFRRAFDDASIGMALTSLDGRWLQVNRALCELLGYPETRLVGLHIGDVTHPEDREASEEALAGLIRGAASTYSTEKRYVHAQGHSVWVALGVSVVHGPDGPRYFVAQMQDVTERRRAQAELAFQAMHDGLTRLPNRALFMDRLAVALKHLERRPWSVAVAFVDLDRFKLVNDSLGHAAGDELLVQVADRLRRVVRSSDTVARLAGDEFTVICEDIVSEDEAATVAGRIVDAMQAPFTVGEQDVRVTASVGVAVTADASDDPDELLHRADAAMYRAKERGTSRSELFRAGMQPRGTDRLAIAAELGDALDRSELRLHYQPEVLLQTGKIVGIEALVRWEHPQRGLLPPGDFVPAAEETGLIVPVGAWVLGEACRQMAAWRDRFGWEGVRMAVNVSARQLADPNLLDTVARALQTSGLAAHQLCLEVTESAIVVEHDQTIATLVSLKDLGVQLAIDDFGLGFSSLARIKALPAVDVLKIDRSFVAQIVTDQLDRAIVSSIVNLAASLGLEAVGEGVETQSQVEHLRRLGCRVGQGFLFGRPAPPEALTRQLDRDAPAVPPTIAP